VIAHESAALRQPIAGERRFTALTLLGAAFVFAYAVATMAGAPRDALSLVYNVPMAMIPPAAWWAVARAPSELRRIWALLAAAASLWLVGSVVWYGYYVAGGQRIPVPPGPWDPVLVAGYCLALGGIVVAVRGAISFRHVALDSIVIVAAALAVGAALVGHGLEDGVTAASLTTLARPVFGLVALTLIATAALEARDGVPLSIALVGGGQVFLTLGSLVYSYAAVQTRYVDDRWTDLLWAVGAVVSLLAGAVVILGIDRPVKVSLRARLPGEAPGVRTVLFGALGTLAVTIGVALYGYAAHQEATLVAGLVASFAIGAAMALRAASLIRELERAYARLDRAQLAEEQANDRLAQANEELARVNVELRCAHTAFGDLLALADERTDGGMRALIEDVGDDLARLLGQCLPRR